jgi:4-hydroxythreonine-4-phosphate dehydrogenase
MVRHLIIMNNLPLIGITQGDPSGIGPEIVIKALESPLLYHHCRPLIFGKEKLFKKIAKKRNIPIFFPKRAYKNSAYAAMELAAEWCLEKKIAALVTSPVDKNKISSDEGIKFIGHTDYLKARCEIFYKKRFFETMFFVGKKEKVALVTTHVPLRFVSTELSGAALKHTLLNVHAGLVHYFGVRNPRIALLGLNPHAGDGGLLAGSNDEEKKVLLPAIRWARKNKFDLHGPFPADSFFAALWNKFDATVALYHDQGLIPFKQRNFLHAVNITLGLPIIRTSVDHGVAYDIAGSGKADPSSLIAAIKLAAQLSKKGPCLQKGGGI